MTYWYKWLNKIRTLSICLGAGLLVAITTGVLALPAHAMSTLDAPLELVFVIDNSGSMRRTDPLFTMRQAVQQFIAQLSKQSRVGLVLFDENIHQLHQLHTISDPPSLKHLISSLDRIDFTGRYTNGPGGIEQALYDFKINGHPESRKAIIFITDGIVTSSSKIKNRELIQWLKQDLIRELQRMGIHIYGVAVAETADIALIHTLASRTDGEYFRARQASELSSALKRIQAHLSPIENQPPALSPTSIKLHDKANPIQGQIGFGSTNDRTTELNHNRWMLLIGLALITLMLATAAIVFFTRNRRLRPEYTAPPNTDACINLPQARLQDLNNKVQGGAASFNLDKAITSIGRGTQNDLCLSQDMISIRHAAIEYKYPAFYLTDLESTNGTGLNSYKLKGKESVRLKSGDTIWFGTLPYQFDLMDQVLFKETVMLEGTSSGNGDMDDHAIAMIDHIENNHQADLMACLKNHLMQIEAIGPKFKQFVHDKFCCDTLNVLVSDGELNLKKTLSDQQLHHTSYVHNNIFYLICTLPSPITEAASWYGDRYSGFTQFVHQWVNSDPYQSSKCDSLCIVTFGSASTHWVSVTIVPTCCEADPVEIISVDFLSSEERSILATEFGQDDVVH